MARAKSSRNCSPSIRKSASFCSLITWAKESRFGFEPEITVKVARRNLRIYEVGISYWGRTYEEGKKIGWKDGVRALYCLLKYSLKEARTRPAALPVPAVDQSTLPPTPR